MKKVMGKEVLWISDIEDWENISVESYQFIIEQAKERLDELINESHAIVARCMTMLICYIAVFSSILGFVFSERRKDDFDAIMILTIALIAIFSIYIFTLLFALIGSRRINYKGSPPKEIFVKDVVEHEDPQLGLKNLIYNEIQRIQDKIERTQTRNIRRMDQYRAVLKVSLFFVAVIVFALFKKVFSVF